MLDIPEGKIIQVTFTNEWEFSPSFSSDERKVIFNFGMNLFSWEIAKGTFTQLTDFRKGTKKADYKLTEQEDGKTITYRLTKTASSKSTFYYKRLPVS